MKRRILVALLTAITAACCFAQSVTIDEIVLGNAASEKRHRLSSDGSQIIEGALGEAIMRNWPEIGKYLDTPFEDRIEGRTRRELWVDEVCYRTRMRNADHEFTFVIEPIVN